MLYVFIKLFTSQTWCTNDLICFKYFHLLTEVATTNCAIGGSGHEKQPRGLHNIWLKQCIGQEWANLASVCKGLGSKELIMGAESGLSEQVVMKEKRPKNEVVYRNCQPGGSSFCLCGRAWSTWGFTFKPSQKQQVSTAQHMPSERLRSQHYMRIDADMFLSHTWHTCNIPA